MSDRDKMVNESESGMAGEKKIGEVISASVIGGLEAKLELDNPEELKIGYPVIVEGKSYNFYCMVHDIVNQPMEIAERLAGSDLRESLPIDAHESYGGRLFYSKAKLRAIQMVEKGSGKLWEPETIPPYFSVIRHAGTDDVEKIYVPTSKTLPIGTLRGVSKFWVNIDFSKLVEKPFGIFGRTGTGKSILNKIVCNGIISKDFASVLIFDMQDEYGVFSRSDSSYGLKYFFPEKVEVFTLDPKKKEERQFVIDPREIEPSDLIVALHDLSSSMIDAIYEINRRRLSSDLLSAIREADAEEFVERGVLPTTLSALKRRIGRLERFEFLREAPEGKDGFAQLMAFIKAKRSIVLNFGALGTDAMAYLFVANIVSRRLYSLYTERNEEFPRVVLFLEEAHKFLSPEMIGHTIFDKLARETRKFNLILAIVDQRPSRIDEEVRSQLANRLILSLKEPSDTASALAGVPDKGVWDNIVSTIPSRTVVVIGDAIRVPTVIDVMDYNPENVKQRFGLGDAKLDSRKLDEIVKDVDELLG